MTSSRSLAIGGVLLAMLLIQTSAGLGRLVLSHGEAVGLTFLRLAAGSALLLVWLRLDLCRIMSEHWRDVAVLGAMLALFNVTFYAALKDLPVGVVATIGFLGPLGVGFLQARSWRQRFWPALALSGTIFLFPWREADSASWTAIGLALLYALAWALYILASVRTSRTIAGLDGLALAMAVAALLLAPLGLASAGAFLATPMTAALALGVAIVAVAGLGIEYLALKRIDAGLFSMLLCLEPGIASLAGIMIAGDDLSTPAWIGISCVVGAAFGAAWSRDRT